MDKITEYLEKIDEVIAEGKFKDNWESLSQFTVPSWYRQKRFGIFIHWGVYSVPSCENEWYPRLMYKKGTKSNLFHSKKYGMDFEYSSLAKSFKPEKFNAEEWAELFKKSGAGYIMPVGEHHDGIKMYKSELNRWNMFELNGRDYMAELHEACDKADLGFMMSNHRAEHFWFFNGARKYYPDSEVCRGINTDLYGPAFMPDSGNIDKTDKEIFATEEYLRDWLATACEMIDRNRPIAVYFDWWIHKDEFRPYLKKFLAYYYNRGLEWGKEVAVFYKWGAVFDGCAIFDVERGQIDGVSRELWQNDTSIGKRSWGYTNDNDFKTSGEIIRNMIEVVAKNGCYMLNVGPKPDGTICDDEKKVLLDIGEWLKTNGDAIYGSYPFEVCPTEGKKRRNGAFHENQKYSKKDFCFTAKAGKIYIFPMGKQIPQKLTVKSLRRSNEHGIRYEINSVKVLGTNSELKFSQNEKALTVFLDKKYDNSTPICICVEVK